MQPLNSSFRPRLPTGPRKGDLLATVCIWILVLGTSAVFLWMLGELLWNGLPRLSWEFLSQGTRDAGRQGGILPVLVSSLWILGIAMAAAIPLALATAVWLAEMAPRSGRLGTWIRRGLDILAAVPSIVFGLFGNALFCVALGLGYSILSGGLTLACMILPLLTRSLEASLRQVPDSLRLAAAALGMSRGRTLWAVLLPTASQGLVAGTVLSVGRVLAETAALLFTSGYVDRMPSSPLDSGRSLSIHIYDLAMHVPGGEASAHGTAVVLVLLLLVINAGALYIGGRWQRRMQGSANL